MRRLAWLAALLLFGFTGSSVSALDLIQRNDLRQVNRRIHGQVIDHTYNHGQDRRLWSTALCEKRDLYVYLPPCFDPSRQYPVMIWFHGFAQDEESFLDDVVEKIDQVIACGKLPPAIVAAPDGSLSGRSCLMSTGSFFINSKAGRFEDYVMQDVWPFLVANYPIRPEREAHALAGNSMGGAAAYNLAIKHRDCFKIVIGIFPPLNMRWVDCHCDNMGNFDPCCWGWLTRVRRWEVAGRFFGVVTIRYKHILGPLFGFGPDAIENISRENPIEMIDAYGLKEGELSMYVAYGGRDEFNIDAQVESFVYRAEQRGLTVTVGYEPRGRHDRPTAYKLFPAIVDWLAPQLTDYAN